MAQSFWFILGVRQSNQNYTSDFTARVPSEGGEVRPTTEFWVGCLLVHREPSVLQETDLLTTFSNQFFSLGILTLTLDLHVPQIPERNYGRNVTCTS